MDSCRAGLRSLAALIFATLLVSRSPSGAFASHSSMVRVDFGCGVRIFRVGVFERLAAMNSGLSQMRGITVHNGILSYLQPTCCVPSPMSSFSANELLTSSGPVVITDQLASPGDFLLHQLLSEFVKGSPDGKCIIISTSQDSARWKAISSRSVGSYCTSFLSIQFSVQVRVST